MRIAFYAPLKPADDPTPSGDRRMSGLVLQALARAGHAPVIASRLRAYEGAGDAARQAEIRARAEAEAERLIAAWRADPPGAWLTYHLYHRAPDWIGPKVAAALGIPYLAVEASFAPKRKQGEWAVGHAQVEAALRQADAVLSLTRLDRACVAPLLRAADRHFDLPPFLDPAPFAAAARERDRHRRALGLGADRVWLLAVGMMRAGPKRESYRQLAAATALLGAGDWGLLVVGDGPQRAEVEQAFAGQSAVRFAGQVAPDDLPAYCAACDLYVWPAVHEAYGMALVEAQAAGLPVVAGRVRGVPDAVNEGVSAILVPPDDPVALARAARTLIDDTAHRRAMGEAAARWIAAERDLAMAARVLNAALERATR